MDRRRFLQVLAAAGAAVALGQVSVGGGPPSPAVLGPRKAYAYVDVSRRALDASLPEALELIRRDLLLAMARQTERAALEGLEPVGLLQFHLDPHTLARSGAYRAVAVQDFQPRTR